MLTFTVLTSKMAEPQFCCVVGLKVAFLEPRRLLERLENSWQGQATSLLTRDSAIANNVVGFLIALASVFAWFGVFAAHRSAAKLAIRANSCRLGFALG
jgi:hypothetical protein